MLLPIEEETPAEQNSITKSGNTAKWKCNH